MSLMNLIMGFSKFLAAEAENGGEATAGGDKFTDVTDLSWYKSIFKPIVEVLNMMVVPLLILVGTAGSIYAIILGVKYARAESADAREEEKKRLINAVIGLIAMLALMALLFLFVKFSTNIANLVAGYGWNGEYAPKEDGSIGMLKTMACAAGRTFGVLTY